MSSPPLNTIACLTFTLRCMYAAILRVELFLGRESSTAILRSVLPNSNGKKVKRLHRLKKKKINLIFEFGEEIAMKQAT